MHEIQMIMTTSEILVPSSSRSQCSLGRGARMGHANPNIIIVMVNETCSPNICLHMLLFMHGSLQGLACGSGEANPDWD